MTHLSNEILIQYAGGNLPPSELLSSDDHLAECEACRNRLAGLQNIATKSASLEAQLQAFKPTDHLSYEDFESFVDGMSDPTDREIVESHLEFCTTCSEQIDRLKKVKASLTSSKTQQNKIVFLWKSQEYSTIFRTVSLAAILAIVALIVSLFTKGPDDKLQAQLEEANQKLQLSESKIKSLNTQVAELRTASKTENGAQLVASLQDSNRTIGIDQKGQLVGGENFSEPYKQLARAAFNQKRLQTPAWLGELQGKTEILMGNSTDGLPIRILGPVGIVVESAEPRFQWKPLQGASEYRISVYDANFHPVISSPPLTTTSWTVPVELPRGQIFTWKITAMKNGNPITSPVPPAPEAKFKILESEKLHQITSLRNSDSHFLLAIAYSDAGMLSEARTQLQELSKENPESSLLEDLSKSINKPR